MKKIISVFLISAFFLSFCSCSFSNIKTATSKTEYLATIFTNEGETVHISIQDLLDEYEANEARFKKLYGGANICFTGTVKSVKIETDVYSGNKSWITQQNVIIFEEGWKLIIGKDNTLFDLSEYYPGQKLNVSTGILSPYGKKTIWVVGNDSLHGHILNNQSTSINIYK